MIEKNVTGLVLGKREFENEHIVKILSEGGSVLSLKAKGLSNNASKNNLSLQQFNKVEVEYFPAPLDSNRGRIKRATVIKEYIDDTEQSYAVAQVMNDILYPVSSHNNAIYEAVLNVLTSLKNKTYNFQKIWSLFIMVLRNEGYRPVIDKCVLCGTNQNINAFSLYEGGLICNLHQDGEKYKMTPELLRKIIEIYVQKNPLNCDNLNLTPDEVKYLKSMYKMFFENQLGLNLYLIKNI